MRSLADAIVTHPTGPRPMTAVVSDIDWTAKTLTADVGAGDPIPGIPWVEPWSPDIEAFGAILPACKGWIFLPLSTNIISP